MLYKDKDNNAQAILYRKPTDQESYLHAKLGHPSASEIVSHTIRL